MQDHELLNSKPETLTKGHHRQNHELLNPVTGQGLGITYSSHTQTGPVFPQDGIGQAGILFYLNVANGNLCTKDRPIRVQTSSGLLELGFIHNSQGGWQWSLRKLVGTADAPVMQEEDGHLTPYRMGARRAFYAPGFGNGTPYMEWDEQTQLWTWYHPGKDRCEQYNAKGLLIKRMDSVGRILAFHYNPDNTLHRIEDSEGNRYEIVYSGQTILVFSRTNIGSQTLIKQYQFDASGRLLQSQVPDAESPDWVYTTTYAYRFTDNLITAISQTDGTTVSIEHDLNRAGHRVPTSFRIGKGITYRITYASDSNPNCAIVQDGFSAKTTLFYDEALRLTRLDREKGSMGLPAAGVDTTTYRYAATGQLAAMTLPSLATTTYAYDNYGVMWQQTEPNGQQIQYHYVPGVGSGNPYRLISISRRLDAKTLLTEYFVYGPSPINPNYPFHRFKISPMGRVTEYRPDNKGNVGSVRTYLTAVFDVGGGLPTSPVSIHEMEQWVALQNPEHVSLMEYICNARSQRIQTQRYAHIDAKGHGIQDAEMYKEVNSWTQFNDCNQHYVVQNATEVALTARLFDGLQRLIRNDDPLKHRTSIAYTVKQAGTDVQTTYPNGRIQTEILNSDGVATGQVETATHREQVQTRATHYARDPAARLVRATLPDGKFRYTFHDKQNRPCYTVTPHGYVTEHAYDRVNRYEAITHYANPIDAAKLYNPKVPNLLPTTGVLKPLIVPNATDDKTSYVFYDASGRVQYSVDAENVATQILYDTLNRRTATVTFASPLSATELNQLQQGKPLTRVPDVSKDRCTRVFYDNDNFTIGKQDAAGFVTAYQRDAGGRVVVCVRYATPAPMNLAITNFADVIPMKNRDNDAYTYRFYNARGQKILVVDAGGFVTQYRYFPSGLRQQKRRYENPVDTHWIPNPNTAPPLPTESPNDQMTTYTYDLCGRPIEIMHPFGRKEIHVYDAMGDVLSAQVSDAHVTDKVDGDSVRGTQSQYDGWQQVTATANPYVNAMLLETSDPVKIAAIWAHDSTRFEREPTGLLCREINELNHATLHYYDNDRRCVFDINPRGHITQYTVNNTGKRLQRRRYATLIPADKLATLSGGFVTPEWMAYVESLQQAQDEIIAYQRDKRDDVTQVTDAAGYVTAYTHTAFQQVETEQRPVAVKAPSLTISHRYETRGLETATEKTAEGKTITITRAYQNLYGHETDRTDETGGHWQTGHDRLGRVDKRCDPEGHVLHTYTRDAFDRILTDLDSLQQITTHQYDEAKRTEVITTPVPDAKTQITRNVFQETIALEDGEQHIQTWTHTPDGNVATACDALGRVTVDRYDRLSRHEQHTAPNGTETQYAYNNDSQLTETVLDAALHGLQLSTHYAPDGFGNPLTVTSANGKVTEQRYDKRDQLESRTRDPKGLALLESHGYNGQGNETQFAEGNNAEPSRYQATHRIDGFNRHTGDIVDPQGLALETRQVLDAAGYVIASHDERLGVTRTFYDGAHRVRFVVSPDGAMYEKYDWGGSDSVQLERYYKTPIDPTAITDSTTFEQLQALAHTTPDDLLMYYFYDGNGRERFRVNRLGDVRETRYDLAGRATVTVAYVTSMDERLLPEITTEQLIALMQSKQSSLDTITYTVFDAADQARYTLDALGFVTEQRYDANGKVIATLRFATAVANPTAVAALPVDEVAAHITHSPDDAVHYQMFDAVGRLISEVDAEAYVTRYQYDRDGNQTQRCQFASPITVPASYPELVVLVNALVPNPAIDATTQTEYDNAGRSKHVTNPLQQKTTTEYDAVSNVTAFTDTTGERWQYEYDADKRQRFKRSTTGITTETRYDVRHRVTITIAYANKEPTPGKAPVPDPLHDRTTYTVVDSRNRLHYQVDAEGAVTEYQYNALNQKIARVVYQDPITAAELTNLLVGKPIGRTPVVTRDQCIRYFYDTAGKVIGKQDAAGFVTAMKRNAAGRVIEKIGYATPSTVDLTVSDFHHVLPPADNAKDVHSYRFYDAKGQVTVSVDPEGAITAYTYTAAGLRQHEVVCSTPVLASWYANTQNPPPFDWATEAYQTHIEYDRLNREKRKTLPGKIVQHTVYDTFGNVTEKSQFDATDNTHIRSHFTRYRQGMQRIATCPPLVAERIHAIERSNLSPPEKAKAIEAVWETQSLRYQYTPEGLLCSELDALGHRTLTYYDDEQRACFTVNAEGGVSQTTYDTFGNGVETRQLATAVSDKVLPTLKGGRLTPELIAYFTSLYHPSEDIVVSEAYDRRNRLTRLTDADRFVTQHRYDAFQHCIETVLPVQDNAHTKTVTRQFDVRNHLTEERVSDGSTTLIETYVFNNYYGKETMHTDAAGGKTRRTWDRRGLPFQVFYPSESLPRETLHYTPYRKLDKCTNSLGQVQATTYDVLKRTRTTIWVDTDGAIPLTRIEQDNAFGELSEECVTVSGETARTERRYAADGQLLILTNPLGEVTTETYNDMGWHLSHQTPDGVITTWDYTAVGQIEHATFDSKGTALTTTSTYNPLGQRQHSVSPNGVLTTYAFTRQNQLQQECVDAKPASSVSLTDTPIQLTTNYTYNGAGDKTSELRSEALTHTQWERHYHQDRLGRPTGYTSDSTGLAIEEQRAVYYTPTKVEKLTDANGDVAWKFYNAASQLCYTITASGSSTAWGYDTEGREVVERSYTRFLDTRFINESTPLSQVAAALAALENGNDAWTATFYNALNRVQFRVNSAGAVVETLYDTAGRESGTYAYAATVNPATVKTLNTHTLAKQMHALKKPAEDRATYRNLDAAGRERFVFNARGYVTEHVFDTVGRIITTIQYAIPVSNPAELAALPSAAIRARLSHSPNDRAHYAVYNASGKVLFKVRPSTPGILNSCAVVGYTYDKANNRTDRCRFAGMISVPPTYEALVALLKALTPNPAVDSVMQYGYDNANRRRRITDEIGNTEHTTRDVLNQVVTRTDRLGQVWTNTYDSARRLTGKQAPPSAISEVTVGANAQLSVHEQTLSVATMMALDKAGNQQSITTAAGTSDARTVAIAYTPTHQWLSNTQTDVVLNDSSKAASLSALPIRRATVTTSCVYDGKGNRVVNVDENGVATFQVFNAMNQCVYTIQPMATQTLTYRVTEHRYNAFGDCEQTIQYDTPLTGIDVNAYRNTGLLPSEVAPHVMTNPADRVRTMRYTQQGKVAEVSDNNALFYVPSPINGVAAAFGISAKTTRTTYNAFDEKETVATLVNPATSLWAVTCFWYDGNGRIVAETDADAHVTTYVRNAHGKPLRQVAYAKPAAATPNPGTQTVAQLVATVPKSADDCTRICEYDVRGLAIIEQLLDETLPLVRIHNDSLTLTNQPGQTLTTQKIYDALKRLIVKIETMPAAFNHPNWGKTYYFYNAASQLVAKTELPRLSQYSPNAPQQIFIPLTVYGVNAHGQQVSAWKVLKGANRVTPGVMPTPVEPNNSGNALTLTYRDNRGLAQIVQDAEGVVTVTLSTPSKDTARRFGPLTDYDAVVENQAVIRVDKGVTHIDETQMTYAPSGVPLVDAVLRDNVRVSATERRYNTFAEHTGEGIGDNAYPAYWLRDGVGQVFLTNAKDKKATLTLFDLRGKPTASMDSMNLPLGSLLHTPAEVVSFLQTPMSHDMMQLERTEYCRSPGGRLQQTWEPAFIDEWAEAAHSLKPVPLTLSFQISQSEGPASSHYRLVWKTPICTTVAARQMMLVGSSNQVIRKPLQYGDGVMWVDVSDVPADVYFYSLVYYPLTPQAAPTVNAEANAKANETVEVTATHVTQGQVQLLTPNRQATKRVLVEQGEDGETLVLSGKLESLTAIALYPCTWDEQGIALSNSVHSPANVSSANELTPAPIIIALKSSVVSKGVQAGYLAVTLSHMASGRYRLQPHYGDVIGEPTGEFSIAVELHTANPAPYPMAQPILSSHLAADRHPTEYRITGVSVADGVQCHYLDTGLNEFPAWRTLPVMPIDKQSVRVDVSGLRDGVYPFYVGTLAPYTLPIAHGSLVRQSQGMVFLSHSRVDTSKYRASLGNVVQPMRTYDVNRWGRVTRETDTLQHTTTYQRNKRQKTLQVTAPEIVITYPNGAQGPHVPVTVYGIDALGYPIATQDANGNTSAQLTDTGGNVIADYKGDGTLSEFSVYDGFNRRSSYLDSRGAYRWIMSYDRVNNWIGTLTPKQRLYQNTYNEKRQRVVSSAPNLPYTLYTVMQYSALSDVTLSVSSSGFSTLTHYGRQHEVIERSTIDGTVSYQTDPYFGQLQRSTDLGGINAYCTYNERQQLIHSYSDYPRGQHGVCTQAEIENLLNLQWNWPPVEVLGTNITHRYRPGGVLVQSNDLSTNTVTSYRTNSERLVTEMLVNNHQGYLYQHITMQYNALKQPIDMSDFNASVAIGYDAALNRRFVQTTIYWQALNGPQQYSQTLWTGFDRANRVTQDGSRQLMYTGDFRTGQREGDSTTTIGLGGYDVEGHLVGWTTETGAGPFSRREVMTQQVDLSGRFYGSDDTKTWPENQEDTHIQLALTQDGYVSDSQQRHTQTIIIGSQTQTIHTTTERFTADGQACDQLSVITETGQSAITDTLTANFLNFMQKQLGALGGTREHKGKAGPYAAVHKYYDANGRLQLITGASETEKNGFMFYNGAGTLLWRFVKNKNSNVFPPEGANMLRYYSLPNGTMVASVNLLMGKDFAIILRGDRPAQMDILLDYVTPIDKHFPPAMPGTYIVQVGDTFESIAERLYGNRNCASQLANANDWANSTPLSVGEPLRLPTLIQNTNNATQAIPYQQFMATLTEGLYPALKLPPAPHHPWYEVVLEIVAVTVLSVVLPEFIGPTLMAVTGMAGFSTAVTAEMAYAMNMALVNAAEQGVAMAFGMQSRLRWSGVFASAMSAAVASNLVTGVTLQAKLLKNTLMAASEQCINLATGASTKFSIDEVIEQTFAQTLADQIVPANTFMARLEAATLEAVADTAVSSVIQMQPPNLETFAENWVGNLTLEATQAEMASLSASSIESAYAVSKAPKPESAAYAPKPNTHSSRFFTPSYAKNAKRTAAAGMKVAPSTEARHSHYPRVPGFPTPTASQSTTPASYIPSIAGVPLMPSPGYDHASAVEGLGTYVNISSLMGSKPWSWAEGVFDDEDDIRYLSSNKAVIAETASGFEKEARNRMLNTPVNAGGLTAGLSLANSIDMGAVLLGKTPPNLHYTIPANQVAGARLFDVSTGVLGTAGLVLGDEALIPESVGFFGQKAEKTLYHTVTSPEAAQGVLNGINPLRFNPSSRFGEGFYLSEVPDTTLAELAHHNAIGVDTIRYDFNAKTAKILDLTTPRIAKAWSYEGGDITPFTREIGARAREAGFNVVRFSSERGGGANIVIFKDFDRLLRPQMIVPSPEFDPKLDLNYYNGMGR